MRATSDHQERLERISGRALEPREGALIGNRAGITEWANAEWMRITGFTSQETLGKPVGFALAESDLDPEIPEFIEGHFTAGLRCVVSLPFERRDGAELFLQLEVVPELDADGSPEGFVALLQDVTERRRREAHARPSEHPERPIPHREGDPIDVNDCVREAVRAVALEVPSSIAIDVELADRLARARAIAGELTTTLTRLLRSAAQAIDDTWGTISVSTGIADAGRPLRSSTYRSSFYGTCHEHAPLVYVELHDTAPAIGPHERRTLARAGQRELAAGPPATRGARGGAPRATVLLEARDALARTGAQLHVASALGAGTRVLILLPLA